MNRIYLTKIEVLNYKLLLFWFIPSSSNPGLTLCPNYRTPASAVHFRNVSAQRFDQPSIRSLGAVLSIPIVLAIFLLIYMINLQSFVNTMNEFFLLLLHTTHAVLGGERYLNISCPQNSFRHPRLYPLSPQSLFGPWQRNVYIWLPSISMSIVTFNFIPYEFNSSITNYL